MISLRGVGAPPPEGIDVPQVGTCGALQEDHCGVVAEQVLPVAGAIAVALALRTVGAVVAVRAGQPGASAAVGVRVNRQRRSSPIWQDSGTQTPSQLRGGRSGSSGADDHKALSRSCAHCSQRRCAHSTLQAVKAAVESVIIQIISVPAIHEIAVGLV